MATTRTYKSSISSSTILVAALVLTVCRSSPILSKHDYLVMALRHRHQQQADTSQTFPQGHNLELYCEASAYITSPMVSWFHNGVLVKQGQLDSSYNGSPPSDAIIRDTSTFTTKSTLVISNAAVEDSGNYTCIAEAGSLRANKTYDITIYPTSSNQRAKRDIEDIMSSSARIYLWTIDVGVNQGVTTLLICRATQGLFAPSPAISWKLNGVPIEELELPGLTAHENGDLEFIASDDYYMAEFNCTATADNGTSDTKSAFIYIIDEFRN